MMNYRLYFAFNLLNHFFGLAFTMVYIFGQQGEADQGAEVDDNEAEVDAHEAVVDAHEAEVDADLAEANFEEGEDEWDDSESTQEAFRQAYLASQVI